MYISRLPTRKKITMSSLRKMMNTSLEQPKCRSQDVRFAVRSKAGSSWILPWSWMVIYDQSKAPICTPTLSSAEQYRSKPHSAKSETITPNRNTIATSWCIPGTLQDRRGRQMPNGLSFSFLGRAGLPAEPCGGWRCGRVLPTGDRRGRSSCANGKAMTADRTPAVRRADRPHNERSSRPQTPISRSGDSPILGELPKLPTDGISTRR